MIEPVTVTTDVPQPREDVYELLDVMANHEPFTVERNIGAGGRRGATGSYRLEELSDGGTRIAFEYAWRRAPLSEQLAAPLVRNVMRRANERALERLAGLLAARGAQPAAG